MTTIAYRNVASIVAPVAPLVGQPALAQSTIAGYQSVLFASVLRNIATDGWVLTDPSGNMSQPGAIIASPSYPQNYPGTDQDYVYNWTRDAAITAFEVAAAPAPWTDLAAFANYVSFAQTCQAAALAANNVSIARACYLVNGQPRSWSDQNDGPALQTLAILALWRSLPAAVQATGRAVIQANVSYLLGCYGDDTMNLWEEYKGPSFFAQSVILKCFQQVLAQNTPCALGLNAARLQAAVNMLNDPKTGLSATFWNATNARYMSIRNCPPGNYAGGDINADVVMASVYGAIPCTDSKLLSSAAQIRDVFTTAANTAYPINARDAASPGVGPMIGRYPGDKYDGDTDDTICGTDHPWAPCTANFAELYYNLSQAIAANPGLLGDSFATRFFAQVGITAKTTVSKAANLLRMAGDKMLQALVYHSDFLELSEQFDGTSGYEKSVRNLTWSYAAFLSALRARG